MEGNIKWTDIVMAFFTVVIAIAAVLQWREMVGGGTQTGDLVTYAKVQASAASDIGDASQQFSDTAEDINGRMQDAVDQLESAAKNAKASIRATQDVMRQDQRAWLGTDDIVSIPAVPEVDKVWDVSVSLKNTGKTPAKNVLMWNTEAVTKDLPDVNADCAEAVKRQASKTMLPPNGSYKAVLHVANGAKVPNDWEKEISDNGTLYVHGCVIYDDVFQRAHWMTYCGSFDLTHKGGGFLACPKYDDTGDGKPPK
jgi:hypothetical protein